jgi:hypothetical protein
LNLDKIHLKDFLHYDYHVIHVQKQNLDILKSAIRKNARSSLVKKICGQLNCFSNILNEGNILFFTPSDDHSLNGRFGPIRSGLYRLIHMAQTNVRILPVNIDYDPLTSGRMRIHITIGPELTNLKGCSKSKFENLLKQAILRLGVIHMGHVGSYLLLKLAENNVGVTTKELLKKSIISQVQKLYDLGLSIDSILLDQYLLRKYLDKFIEYSIKKQWLRYVIDEKLILNKESILGLNQGRHSHNLIQYHYNELMSYQSVWLTTLEPATP